MSTLTNKKQNLFNFFNPLYFIRYFWSHKNLIMQFSKRDVQARYRGSFLGIIWAVLNPLLMLTVYTFVFSVVFKGKWGELSDNKFEFAIILFSGLTLFNIFTECLNKSPMSIIGNPNYVKKVVFPLEILPVVNLISSLVHSCISMLILVGAVNIFLQPSSWGVIFSVFSVIPMIMFTLGLSFLVASLGVFIKDISYSIVVVTSVLVYLTPVFYPITAVPVIIRKIMYFNPLTLMVENFRNSVIFSKIPSWWDISVLTVSSYIIMILGLIVFKKLSSGFSDVL